MNDDVYVYLAKMPNRIRGVVTPCIDGYTIYINDRLDRESMLRTYEHEMRHIKNGDFERSDVQIIEYEAHKNNPPDCESEGSPKMGGHFPLF